VFYATKQFFIYMILDKLEFGLILLIYLKEGLSFEH